MTKKRISKRLIALLLGICMLCATCFHAVSVKATDSETQFTELTLSDLGISGGSYNAGASGTYADGFENTIVSFYVTSTTVAGPPRIHFGSWGQTDRTGINILFYGEALVVGNDGFVGDETKQLDFTRAEILANDFGLTSFVDARILYQLKTEYLALDADGTKNDIRFTLYVNQQEAISVDIKDQVDKLGEYVYFCDGIHVLEDYTDVKLNESPEANYEKLTLSDFEIADGSLNTIGETTVNLGSTLDKTLFQAKMYFPKTDFGSFFLGGADWNGISVKTYGDGNLYMYVISTTGTYELVIDPTKVETNLFENDNLQFAISTEFVELNETAGTTKLKIGVWFDGYLYNNAYFTTEEVAVADLTRHIHGKMLTAGLKGYSIISEESQKELASSEESNYEKFTLSDFAIADGSLDLIGEITVNYGSTLDKTLFQAKMNFSKADFGSFFWGGEGWNGISVKTYGDGNLYMYVISTTGTYELVIDPAVVESDLFENENLEFAISTEFVEADTVAGTTKLKVGVWFDGILYNNAYFMTEEVAIADMTRHIHGKMLTAALKGYSIGGNEPEEVQKELASSEEANYQKYTLSDFEIEDGSLNLIGETTVNHGLSLDKTLFLAKMYFSKTDFGSFFWGGEGWNGISIKTYGDERLFMYVTSGQHTYEFVIDPAMVESNLFENENLEFAISTEFVELDETAGTTKLKIGVWLDGLLYNNAYFMTEEVAIADMVKHVHGKMLTAELKGYSIKSAGSEEPEEEVTIQGTYEKMTMRNYLLEKLTHVSGNISRTYDNKSLNGTSFGATFQFSKDNNGTTAFYLGAKEWCGIRLEAQPDGNLGVSHIGTDGRQKWIAIVAPEEVGMKTFLGEKFELLMTFDTYGENEDRINCKIGLYINGKLYMDDHLTLKNVEKDTLTRSIFIYSGGHGSVSIESIYKKVDFTIWGLSDNWKQTLGIS